MWRKEAKELGFDFYAHHLLCAAFTDKNKYEGFGYTTYLFPEGFGNPKQFVYFLAVKNEHKLTRKERGEIYGRR